MNEERIGFAMAELARSEGEQPGSPRTITGGPGRGIPAGKLAALSAGGITQRRAARILGVTPVAVNRAIKRHGLDWGR